MSMYDDIDKPTAIGGLAKSIVKTAVTGMLPPQLLARKFAVAPVKKPVIATTMRPPQMKPTVSQSAATLKSLGVDECGDDDEPTVAAASSILSASTVNPAVQSSGRFASTTVSMPHASSSSSSLTIMDEYDPAAPNDYELICLERKKVAEAEKRLKSLREEQERASRQLEALEAEKLERAARASERAAAALKEIEGQSAAAKVPSAQSQSSSSGAMDIAAKIMSKMGFRPGQKLGKAADDGAEPVSDSDDVKRRKVDESSSSAHAPPSTVVLLLNMVGRGQVDGDLEVETAEECARYGKVEECVIFELLDTTVSESEAVRIFVRFATRAGAAAAVADLDGRFFDGRAVRAAYWNEDKFERRELM